MKLQFAATWARFDISYTVGQLASFCSNPGTTHLAALHHLMEYLVCYPTFKLVFRRSPLDKNHLDGFVDSDWGSDDARRSTTGSIARYNGTPIAWKSKRQISIALSSAKSEYMAASDFTKDIIDLRRLLDLMGFRQVAPTVVMEDNTACIGWGNNVVGGRERAKHIDLPKHLLMRRSRMDTSFSSRSLPLRS